MQDASSKDGKAVIIPADRKIHGYIYVYDSSNKNTFETLSSLIKIVRDIEKSERRGQKHQTFIPHKMILGNKRDLITYNTHENDRITESDIKQLDIKNHKLVSALSNQGIDDALRVFISNIHSDSILSKELEECEKNKKPDHIED